MSDEQTTLAQAALPEPPEPVRPRGRAARAGRGAHRRYSRRAGHHPHAGPGRAPRLALARDGASGDHGPWPDRDGGGQRRRQRVNLAPQAGQNYGTTLLWVLLLLIPVLIVNQEMVIRLGAVTGVGHARLINERFGRFWGWFSVGDLFVLNFLTIVTEFIGVSLALGYFGVSADVAVPLAAVTLVAITSTGSFRELGFFMYVFVVANFLVIPLLVLAHPHLGDIAERAFIPGIRGGASSTVRCC